MKKKKSLIVTGILILVGIYFILPTKGVFKDFEKIEVIQVIQISENGEKVDITEQVKIDMLEICLALYERYRIPTFLEFLSKETFLYEIYGTYEGEDFYMLAGKEKSFYCINSEYGFALKNGFTLPGMVVYHLKTKICE